jgi:invasion protein IalB
MNRIKATLAMLVLGAVAVAAAPSASAAPQGQQPGAPCSVPGAVSADGTLSCSGQAGIWMHKGFPLVRPGQPCAAPGDVTYARGEQIVTCRPSGSGFVWE